MEQLLAIVAYFSKERAVIADAPATFIIGLILVGGLVWLATSRAYSLRLTNLESELRLSKAKEADYEAKLGGATPGEAQKSMDALERRLTAVEPRRLLPDQIDKMGAILAMHPGQVFICRDTGSVDTVRLEGQLEKLFRQKGWGVLSAEAVGGNLQAPSGIVVATRTGKTLTEQARSVIDAFTAAGVPFDRRQHPAVPLTQSDRDDSELEIHLTHAAQP
ncbi:hypothetical protein NKH98_07495 [Mesorhizobium sp. M0833]|uniref:hypothetical protein n=1 Tax=Mesorhizobium sp. M0833 TaxID=2957009 RepID=UPI003338B7CF